MPPPGPFLNPCVRAKVEKNPRTEIGPHPSRFKGCDPRRFTKARQWRYLVDMKRKILLLAIFFALIAPTAKAEVAHLRFEAYWGGLHAADFTLDIATADHNGGDYENRIHLKARGMTWLFTHFILDAKNRGHADGTVLRPRLYRTDYSNRNNLRWIRLDYDGDTPAMRTAKRPIDGGEWYEDTIGERDKFDVPEDQLPGTVDPLSALTLLLKHTRAHLEGSGPDTFAVTVYDGRRLFRLKGQHLGLATRVINRTEHDTQRLRVTSEPLAGFKKRHFALWDQTQFDFYLTRDADLVPLQIVPVAGGPILTLLERCDSPCALPEAEQ